MASKPKYEEIIHQILHALNDNVSELTNELWAEINRGCPVNCLDMLLNSKRDSAIGAALFLAVELHEAAIPLKGAVLQFSQHPNAFFRVCFLNFSINSKCVDDDILKEISYLLDDTDLHVRAHSIIWILTAKAEDVARLGKIMVGRKNFSLYEIPNCFSSFPTANRGLRAFEVGVRLKIGQSINDIAKVIKTEDNYTFEFLKNYRGKIRRIETARTTRLH